MFTGKAKVQISTFPGCTTWLSRLVPTTALGSPLRHLVPPRNVTRKIAPPTEDNQLPTVTDFPSSRSPRQSHGSSPPVVQHDANNIFFNSAMVNNEP